MSFRKLGGTEMKIADHFTIKELTDTSYADMLAENIYYALDHFNELTKLAQFCERVRKILGVPMEITSGVRCPKLNKKIGGVIVEVVINRGNNGNKN